MSRTSYISILLISCFLYYCSTEQSSDDTGRNAGNPPAEGFNKAASDEKAMEIADNVMEAQGGRKSWDTTRYLSWNFFDRRTLWWDKQTGDVRIKMNDPENTTILLNIHEESGKVRKNNEVMTDPDSVSFYVNRGKGIWINDSYWLFMPFKLKDSGVTLKYVGEDSTESGAYSDVLELTFENVGNTPQNKYHVWVDKSDNLVKQWAFYRENTMEEPNFITPWLGYEKHGNIWLAGDRGERKITDIEVRSELDPSIFTEF